MQSQIFGVEEPLVTKKVIMEALNITEGTLNYWSRMFPDFPLEENPQFREVMQAKFDALSANKIITRLESVKNHTNPNGRCSYEISYYGAVTGRFAAGNEEASGTGSVNMQNFNRDPFYGFAVREIICAEKGKKLLVYDFSQVEAVVLARVSGNKNHLDAVRRKESLYEAEAVGAGVWEKGKPGFKQWTDYIIYKQRVLALGYGLGAMMFQRRMLLYLRSHKDAL
jgi:hypothetical protein